MALPRSFHSILILASVRDSEAISYLYNEYYPDIHQFVLSRRIPHEIAEDITSDIFEEMMCSIHKLEEYTNLAFISWLYQIARTTIADYYRKNKRRDGRGNVVQIFPLDNVFEEAYSVPSPDDPTQVVEAIELSTVMRGAINDLPTDKRQVVDGRFFLGQSSQVMAQRFNTSPKTIDDRQYQALKTMSKNPDLRRWINIVIIFLVTGLATTIFIGYIGHTEQNWPGYPVKVWWQQMFPSDSGDDSHNIDVPTPSPTFTPILTPTLSPSPTPTETPTPVTRTIATSTPTTITKTVDDAVDALSTATSLTSPASSSSPTCVLGGAACLDTSLP